MVATDTLFIVILEVLVVAIASYYGVKGVRVYMKRRKPFVKTPKVRGRNYLFDSRFGTAMGIGYTPLGIDKYNITLMGRDGHVFNIPYNKEEIFPENPVQAFVGAVSSFWRVKGQSYLDKVLDSEKIRLEEENKKLKEETLKQDVRAKQLINEAAVIPDKMEELIKDFQKKPSESIKVVR